MPSTGIPCWFLLQVASVGRFGCWDACISLRPLARSIEFTSPVRTLSFASRPMSNRLPSSVHESIFSERSLTKARRGLRSSLMARSRLSCCEYTEPVASDVSGLGRYPLRTRSFRLFFPWNRVHTHLPMPVSSAPEEIARCESEPVVICAVPPNSVRALLLSCWL